MCAFAELCKMKICATRFFSSNIGSWSEYSWRLFSDIGSRITFAFHSNQTQINLTALWDWLLDAPSPPYAPDDTKPKTHVSLYLTPTRKHCYNPLLISFPLLINFRCSRSVTNSWGNITAEFTLYNAIPTAIWSWRNFPVGTCVTKSTSTVLMT